MIPDLNIISLKNTPIFKQLQLEEALLRAHTENFCLINQGSSEKAIVMGISSPTEDHLNQKKVQEDSIPVIKRFSGGGTVFVDKNTFFVTFIFQEKTMPILAFPEPILKWSESFYKDVFNFDDFALRENDFVFGEKKFGGNAKYIRKDRWLLHTSFLFDYDPNAMQYLSLPTKRPKYRKDRSHEAFLTRLNERYSSQKDLLDQMKKALFKHFHIQKVYESYPNALLENEHRKTTTYLSL